MRLARLIAQSLIGHAPQRPQRSRNDHQVGDGHVDTASVPRRFAEVLKWTVPVIYPVNLRSSWQAR
jgi:hypothetical protein